MILERNEISTIEGRNTILNEELIENKGNENIHLKYL